MAYKILSLTYKTSSPPNLHIIWTRFNLIATLVPWSSVVILARSYTFFSLFKSKQSLFPLCITLSLALFTFERNMPVNHHSLSLSSHHTHISSSSPSSPLSPSITHSIFHSRLTAHLLHKFFPPCFYLFSHRGDSTDSNCSFIPLCTSSFLVTYHVCQTKASFSQSFGAAEIQASLCLWFSQL